MNPGSHFSLRDWLNTKLVIVAFSGVSIGFAYLAAQELRSGASNLLGDGERYAREVHPFAYWFFVSFHILVSVSCASVAIQVLRGKIRVASEDEDEPKA